VIPLKKILNIENDLNPILSTPQEKNLRIVGTYKKMLLKVIFKMQKFVYLLWFSSLDTTIPKIIGERNKEELVKKAAWC
jgi:hypothetical protein